MNANIRTPHASRGYLDFGDANAPRPSQRNTAEEFRLARRYVEREAVDLLEMLFGRAS